MPMAPNFNRLLADLWNEIRKNPFILRLSISEDDIVVFGAYRIWQELEKRQKVNRSQAAGEGVKSIVYVDTPSFLTGYDNIDARKEIMTWINRTGRDLPHLLPRRM
ncbi:hypothetical protein OG21DRAFT_131949 [Imleria badia]|nr:hypothetical protein OG21DRAFT_131949 [Imleria badia]